MLFALTLVASCHAAVRSSLECLTTPTAASERVGMNWIGGTTGVVLNRPTEAMYERNGDAYRFIKPLNKDSPFVVAQDKLREVRPDVNRLRQESDGSVQQKWKPEKSAGVQGILGTLQDYKHPRLNLAKKETTPPSETNLRQKPRVQNLSSKPRKLLVAPEYSHGINVKKPHDQAFKPFQTNPFAPLSSMDPSGDETHTVVVPRQKIGAETTIPTDVLGPGKLRIGSEVTGPRIAPVPAPVPAPQP